MIMKLRFTTVLAVYLFCGFASLGAEPNSKPTPSATPTSQELTLDLGDGVTMKFAKIPAGKFMMGVPKDAPDREKQDEDEHEVTIVKDFWMGATEVTQAQYQSLMGDNPSKSGSDPQFPVDAVTPKQVEEFCKKLSEKTGKSVRLPTEAEWEYAARAGSDGLGGAKITDAAWCRSNGDMKPHPVGTKAPNAWGLYDMLGNANEWAQGEKWIGYRGGCWRTLDSKCKPTHREGHGRLHSDPYGGFRVVVEAK